jgi:hypothetical protein
VRERGVRVPHRTRHSFQIDHDIHIVVRNPIELINHSCEPNCGVLVRRDEQMLEIYALRRIERGEELFTDYATFEEVVEHMSGPCQCGTRLCRGWITSHHGLPAERRAAFGRYIAEYLQEAVALS